MTSKGTFRWRGCAGAVAALAFLLVLAACQHKVQVEAPKDPIVINLNVKIEQEVRIKVEEDVEDLFADNPDLF
jgi:cobalamin biosynthesis protein CbiD